MNAAIRPRSIALLVEGLDSGGAEALAVDIAGALAHRGHDAHLIVLRSSGPLRGRVDPAVRFHDLDRPRRDGSQVGRIAYFLGTCRRLEALLRAEHIEVLHSHLPKANFLGLVMAWRGVCRSFPTVHNNREFDYGDNAGSVKQRLRKMGYRQMLKHCDGVVAVSEQVKRSLLKDLGAGAVDGKRLHVVANGVREMPAVSADERTVARAIWGMQSEEILIVGIGRLTAQKDFASLLRALALLPADARGWRCIIAGEGELQQDLERLTRELGLSDRVRLAGLVPDVRGLLAAADIFCLPSRFEGLPLVLLEAMAAGLPVAAFAIDGIADVVTNGVQARLVPPGDSSGLASALGTLMADSGERRRLGEAGRLLVGEQYDFNRVIIQLEKVYGS